MLGGAKGRRLDHMIKFLKAGKSVSFVASFSGVNPKFVEKLAKVHAPKKKPVAKKPKVAKKAEK